MYAQTLLPALALLGAASAQTNQLCSQNTVTINSQADATALESCRTVKSIVVGPDAGGVIDISGPQQVTGNITCNNAGQLTSLTSSSIGTIGGTFALNNLTLLSTLSFTDLTSVGTIDWEAIPNLASLTFPAQISTATSVTIANTFLNSLDGINLMTVGTLNINNNRNLKLFSTQVANITNSLIIAGNDQNLEVDFPNLIWANNLDFRNISSLNIPSLATVNNSLSFDESFIKGVSTPNLTSIGSTANRVGTLTFVGNLNLGNVTFPVLKTIGGSLDIANNSALDSISFPKLTQVGGAIDLSGNFTDPDFSSLNDVAGTMNVQSTATIDCKKLQALNPGTVQGAVTCKSQTDDPTSLESGSSGTGTSSGSGSSGSKGAAPASYSLDSRTIGLSVVGGLLGLLV